MVCVWIDGVLFYKTLDLNEALEMRKFLIEEGIDRNNICVTVEGCRSNPLGESNE